MPNKAKQSKQPKAVTFRHRYLLSGPVMLDDNTTRVEIHKRRVTVADADTIDALDALPAFEREETR